MTKSSEVEMLIEVRPWPTGQGHTVYIGGDRAAEVFSPDGWAGLKVTTYDPKGDPDLILRHPSKVSPSDAVSLCFVLGIPSCDDATPYYDVNRLFKRHGKKSALILETRGGLNLVGVDLERMEELGLPADVFPEFFLGEVLAKLAEARIKAVVCEPEGGDR